MTCFYFIHLSKPKKEQKKKKKFRIKSLFVTLPPDRPNKQQPATGAKANDISFFAPTPVRDGITMYLVWHSWVVKVVDLFSSYRAMREYYLYVSDYTLCAIDLPFEDVIMHILYMQSSIHAASCRPVLPGFRRDNNHRHLSSIDTSSACVCMPLTPSTFTPPAHSEIPKVIRHATRVSSHKVSIYIYTCHGR